LIRPNKATDILVAPEHIHPAYELRYEDVSLATETGHLVLFRLEPSESSLPTFSARWDLKPNTVDIDLIGGERASREFKAGVGDYSGHHTTLVSETPRIYQAELKIPAGVVFRGKITFIGEGAVHMLDSFENLTKQIKDELRIIVVCESCGPVEVSGPPFVLSCCPKCKGTFAK